MIKTYKEYLKQLKILVKKNNYRMLSDSDIISFIQTNSLDSNYSVTISDVKTDINAIISNHKQYIRIHNQQRYQNSKKKTIPTKTVKTYQQYVKLLETAIANNQGARLNNIQVNDFIHNNNLDRDWGITNIDVYKDMSDYFSRISPNTYVKNVPVKDNISEKKDLQKYKEHMVEKNESLDEKQVLSDDDLDLITQISKYMNECPSAFKEIKRIEAVLRDIIPDKIMEINLLSFLAREGILAEQNLLNMDEFIRNRYVSMLISNYGTDSSIAKRMVQIWMACLNRV